VTNHLDFHKQEKKMGMEELPASGQFALVVAHDQQLGIGKDNQLPWKISGDMSHFRQLTTKVTEANRKNIVIMGRKTWQSIPQKFRPLPRRYNIVLTSDCQSKGDESTFFCGNFDQALKLIGEMSFENCFVIGGGQVYRQALLIEQFDLIYATQIEGDFQCDTTLPDYRKNFALISQSQVHEESPYRYQFNLYRRHRQ
jgi:dihydrofolate reductase